MTNYKIIKAISDTKYKFMGNGFIDNENGVLITAGHVLKNYKTQSYFAIENNTYNPLKITVLFYEFEEIYNQKAKKYKDLALCAIGLKGKGLTSSLIKLKVGDSVKVKGFLNENTSKEFDINDKAKLEKIELKTGDSEILFLDAMISDLPKDVEDRKNANPERFFDNAFSIKKVLRKGISGSPVLTSENVVCGMYIGSDTIVYENPKSYVIKIDYINECIQNTKIK